jgi:hypothetical protein
MWVLLCGLARCEITQWSQAKRHGVSDGGPNVHSLIYHVLKHLLRGLAVVIQHLIHQAPAAPTVVRHAPAAHTVAVHALGRMQPARGAFTGTAMPVTQVGAVPLSSTAAALHAQNVQSGIMASVGQEQAAAIPDVGDFSLFSS